MSQSHPGILQPSSTFRYSLNSHNGHVEQARFFNNKKNAWEPIEKEKNYKIAIDDYITGSQEYPEFSKAAVLKRYPFVLNQLFQQALKVWSGQNPNSSLKFIPDGRVSILA